MPHVLHELFADCGVEMKGQLELERLGSACRYFWRDGTVMDEDESFWRRPEVAAFLEYARGIYELSGEAYLHHPPHEMWRALGPANWGKLRYLPKVATWRTLAEEVDRRIQDPHVRQIFKRFATYNGSSPYRTPATFNIIPYVEATFGGWYARGGMARIAEALASLAQEKGVSLQYGKEALAYAEGRVWSQHGDLATVDRVVCNADVLQARPTLFGQATSVAARRGLRGRPLSCSGLVFFLGVNRRYPALGHHNIFFSDDYPGEFADLFDRGELPREPTIYVAITARADSGDAPPDCDNYFVLINAPPRGPGQRLSAEEVAAYQRLVLARLEAFGLENLSQHVETASAWQPADFAVRDGSYRGSLYGWASHGIRPSLFRPPMRLPGDRRVFFVGGTTHPGGGIPLVLLSAQMAVRTILREEPKA
jgi:phytoene desaturase